MTDVISAVLFGFGFGFLLHRAGLTHYARIVNVYRLRDMTVIKFMLAALLTGGLLVELGSELGLAEAVALPRTAALANLVGGVVFGVGMATAGYCPGTIVAEAGELRLDAATAGLAGLLAGALLFGLLQPLIMPALARRGALGNVTLSSLLGVSPWLVWLVIGELWLLVWALATRPKRLNAP